jgi:hypothetical protein
MQIDISKQPAVKVELTMSLDELSELYVMMDYITRSSGWRDASKHLASDILNVIKSFHKSEDH